jgi:dTDP-glucose pyrophosphorylase
MKGDCPINVIIPMAGLGSRFTEYGFTRNKYMLPVNKNHDPMIEKAITTLQVPENSKFFFILREENGPEIEVRELLGSICKRYKYQYEILSVKNLTEGPTCTSYIAKEYIDNDTPLLISNSDQILDWKYHEFLSTLEPYDSGVLTYTPNYPLVLGSKDKHSFVRKENGIPVEFVEKHAISDEALVGVHYYKKGSYFIKAAEYTFEKNIRAPNGEFYLSYTYQALLDMKYSVGTYKLPPSSHFYPVGEPLDYFAYYNPRAQIEIKPLHTNIKLPRPFQLQNLKSDTYIFMENSFGVILTGDYDIDTRIIKNGTRVVSKNPQIMLVIENVDTSGYTYIDNYVRGWLIGDFTPSILRTSEYEVGFSRHKGGEHWGFHYHHELDEYNILISGKMMINNQIIHAGEYFMIPKDVIACPKFLEDCTILCLKSPSKPKDKIII